MTYPFDQAWQGERDRLLAIEHLFDATTHAHLVDLGVGPGWNCLEVGAGAGSIAHWLAGRVGPAGTVLATDTDIRFVEPAADLEVRRHDIAHDDLPRNAFDLVHARLVLAYVEKPEHALQRIIDAVRPGGWLLVEEADHGVMPTRAGYVDPIEYRDLFRRISDAYIGLINAGGGDPEFGAALPHLLLAGGLTDVGATAHIPFMFGGRDPHVARLTLETLGDTMVAMGLLTAEDVAEYLALSNRPGMWQALVPCVSAWGRRPADHDARHLDEPGEHRG